MLPPARFARPRPEAEVERWASVFRPALPQLSHGRLAGRFLREFPEQIDRSVSTLLALTFELAVAH